MNFCLSWVPRCCLSALSAEAVITLWNDAYPMPPSPLCAELQEGLWAIGWFSPLLCHISSECSSCILGFREELLDRKLLQF